MSQGRSTRLWSWVTTAIIVYSSVLSACFIGHVRDEHNNTLELARSHARTAWAKDVDYRRWCAGHGGVYVPLTNQSPANPYLLVPEREVTTPSGRVLTLVNPAYMTRQVHELAQQRNGVRGHITSLRPIRPENVPDEWEAEALRTLEHGEAEVSSRIDMDGVPFMRLMHPLVTEASCLKCHAAQGYRVGDIRGGISATLPMTHLLAMAATHIRYLVMTYVVLWFLGLLTIGLATYTIRRRIIERDSVQSELIKARDVAQAATQAKDLFLANMSHEIRTPMTAILGCADLIADSYAERRVLEGRQLGETVHMIRRNGEHLLELINNILDLSKIEARKLDVELRPCSPHEIMADVSALVTIRVHNKGLSFGVEFAGPIPEYIQTDPLRLRQILVNLIGNAIKFTPAGGIRLFIRMVEEGGEPRMQIDVIDTGIGLTPEQAGQLFQSFMQADISTTRQYGGTGLGLVISRELARLLGGDTVLVDSEPGLGTRFRVTIATGPLDQVRLIEGAANDAEVIRLAQVNTKNPLPKEGEKFLEGVRILLVEDGEDNQRLIGHFLKKVGAEVDWAENGSIGLDKALAANQVGVPFNLILMDMQMPVMDGYEATRRLRATGYRQPILALTAHAMTHERQKCLDAGCDDFINKPIVRPVFFEVLRKYTSTPGPGFSSAPSSPVTAHVPTRSVSECPA